MQTIRSSVRCVLSPTLASVKSWPGVWAAGPELTGIAAHRSCKQAERRIIRHLHQWTSAPRKRGSLTGEGAAGQRRWCDRAGGTDQSHMLLQLDSAAPGCRSKLVNMYYFFIFFPSDYMTCHLRMNLQSRACVYCRNTPVSPWACSTLSQSNV